MNVSADKEEKQMGKQKRWDRKVNKDEKQTR